MKPLKFRAWEKKNRIFIYAELHGRLEEPFVAVGEYPKGLRFSSPSKLEWEQNTNIKDCHGKEIYEGDILKWTNPEADPRPEEVPPMILDHFADFDGMFDQEFVNENDENQFMNVEVIGNLHENHERLNDGRHWSNHRQV